MHRLSVTSVVLTFAVFLLASVGTHAETPFGVPFELEKAVHFVNVDGDPVLLEAGRYLLAREQLNLRIAPTRGGEGLVTQSRLLSHDGRLAGPIALSTPGREDLADVQFVTLLMPGGESLTATGSYSGVMARGWLQDTWKNTKKITNRIQKDVDRNTKKVLKDIDKNTKQVIKDIDKNTQQVIKDVQKGGEQFAKDAERAANNAGNWIADTYMDVEEQVNNAFEETRKGLEDRMRLLEKCLGSNLLAGDTDPCANLAQQVADDHVAAWQAALDAVLHMLPGAEEFLQQLLCEATVAIMQGSALVDQWVTGPIEAAVQELMSPATTAVSGMIEPYKKQVMSLLEPEALMDVLAPHASELERIVPMIAEAETVQQRSGQLRGLLLSPQVCTLSPAALERKIRGILGPSLARIEAGQSQPVRTAIDKRPETTGGRVSSPPPTSTKERQADVQRSRWTTETTTTVASTAAQPINTDHYYQITNERQKNGRSQSLESRPGDKDGIFMGRSDPSNTGQMWKLTPLGDGLYRLTSALLGEDRNLTTRRLKDSWRAGQPGSTLFMDSPGNRKRQMWKLMPRDGGTYMLTTKGDMFRSLAANTRDEANMRIGNADPSPGQSWTLVRLAKISRVPQPRGAAAQTASMTTGPQTPRWRPLLQPVARGAGDLDQAWTPSTRTGEKIRAGTTSAQTFTVGKTGLLSRIALRVNRKAWTDGDLVVEIRSVDDEGLPSEKRALFTTALSPSELPLVFSEELTEIDVRSGGVMVQAGDRLAVTVTNRGGVDYEWWYSDGYKGGGRYVRHAGEWGDRVGDFVFSSEVDAEGLAVATRGFLPDQVLPRGAGAAFWLGVHINGIIPASWTKVPVDVGGGIGWQFPSGTVHGFLGATVRDVVALLPNKSTKFHETGNLQGVIQIRGARAYQDATKWRGAIVVSLPFPVFKLWLENNLTNDFKWFSLILDDPKLLHVPFYVDVVLSFYTTEGLHRLEFSSAGISIGLSKQPVSQEWLQWPIVRFVHTSRTLF